MDLCVRAHSVVRRPYAVKRLHPHLHSDPEFQQMFLEEARLAGMIHHPNVVAVHEVAIDERGPYLVMDYIDGVDLRVVMGRLASRGQRIPLPLVLQIMRDVARGLHAAHELCDEAGVSLGLVHRDVSPQNILLGFDGSVRLTDFGIAKAHGHSLRTATGVLKGKLGYLSPEQLQYRTLDRRSDLFSFGVLLFEALSGERLYRNEDGRSAGERILDEPPPDIGEFRTDVPFALVDLLFGLLAKDPGARPATAEEVADALHEAALDLDDLPLDLSAFVQEIAGDAKKDLPALLMAAEEATVLASGTAVLSVGVAVAPKRWRGKLGVAALASVAVAGALVVAVVAQSTSSSDSDRPTPAAMPTADTAAVEAPVEHASATEQRTTVVVPADAIQTSSTMEEVPDETLGTTEGPRDGTPRRGMRRRAKRSTGMADRPAGLGGWSWTEH